jgi:hypothetical protein
VPIRKDGAIEKSSKASTFVPVSWYFFTSKLSVEGQEIERKSHNYYDSSKLATAPHTGKESEGPKYGGGSLGELVYGSDAGRGGYELYEFDAGGWRGVHVPAFPISKRVAVSSPRETTHTHTHVATN